MQRTPALLASSLFFFAAPGTVAGLIPLLITHWRIGAAPFWLHLVGALLIAAGLALLIESFARFVAAGGTPAPVLPTQRLVVEGAYAYVRNPMYVAVTALILGQALLFAHAALVAYGVFVFVCFLTFVVFFEEHRLARTYPGSYAVYAANVPRWLPRLTPWRE